MGANTSTAAYGVTAVATTAADYYSARPRAVPSKEWAFPLKTSASTHKGVLAALLWHPL